MLGIREISAPIKGQFAEEMIESLKRANNGDLNERETSCIEREEELSKMFSSVWI